MLYLKISSESYAILFMIWTLVHYKKSCWIAAMKTKHLFFLDGSDFYTCTCCLYMWFFNRYDAYDRYELGAHLLLNDWGIGRHSWKGSTKKAPIFNVHTKHILLYKCNGDLKKKIEEICLFCNVYYTHFNRNWNIWIVSIHERTTIFFLSVFASFNVSILLCTCTCKDNDGSVEQLNGIVCYSY